MATKTESAAKSAVEYVQIDGLVILKMIKHCQEEGAGGTDLVRGVLLGLVENNRLEVTNCFPFPRLADEDDFDEGTHKIHHVKPVSLSKLEVKDISYSTKVRTERTSKTTAATNPFSAIKGYVYSAVVYQMEMMRNLRQVNIDHLHVGWYQSTYFGSFINKNFLHSQFDYQSTIEESIVLIYDPLRTAKGHLTLKAMRLTPALMDLYREGDFSPEIMRKSGVSFETMFEEVPIVIKNSHLLNSLLCDLEDTTTSKNKFNFLDLATGSVLEKNVRMLIECVDCVNQDSNKFFNYQRQHSKQQQAKQQHIMKRQQENEARKSRGEAPLPDDDIAKLFKPMAAPPRLEPLLWAGQVDSYTAQINEFSTQSFAKLFMADSLQTDSASK